ncbi:MAG: FAD-dependent oxidoreductase, partial [Erysipelotrichaceae bacterium]|nr:FAD-dependent oxidoreductase [Erysipelotrichaceae bacterium]
AEYLLEKGCKVTIVEMMDKIANGESSTILPIIMKDFKEHEVTQYVNTKVTGISEDGKTVFAMKGEEKVEISCDTIVMAVGSKKNSFDETGITKPITYVGDCASERTADIANAIRTAYKAVNAI